MDPPPPAPFPSSSSSSPSSSSNASVTMVIITVVGIFAAFALLASYYAFVTRCQPLRALLWSRDPPWRRRARSTGTGGDGQLLPHQERPSSSVVRAAVARSEHRGLGLPFIRMLPVVKFTAAASAAEADDLRDAGRRISVSECAVCLSEFVERERVRLLPNCSHAFHIDCIDTWLQGSARCPFCRSDVTLPAAVPLPAAAAARVVASKTARTAGTDDSHHHHHHRRRDDDEVDSIVIEVRGERESWLGHGGDAGTPSPAGGRRHHKKRKAESVGDEAIDTRRRSKDDEAFAVVQPLRRSLSLDSSCDKHLYDSVVRELLITTTQRQQVAVYDPSVN